MNLTELFTPKIIAANYTEAASNAIPYLGSGLFPSVKRAGLDLAWIKGHKGLPVSLKPSAFDAKATFRDRIGVSKLETEMPFFREGYKIEEKDRQEILRAQSSNDPYAADVINRVYDDQQDLIAGADVVPERMRMRMAHTAMGKVQTRMDGFMMAFPDQRHSLCITARASKSPAFGGQRATRPHVPCGRARPRWLQV